MNSALSGGDVPEATEEHRKEVATDVTTVHSHGIVGRETLEHETRGGLESEMHSRTRKKWREPEQQIYVQLSEDHSSPEHMARKHRQVSRSPSTLEHVEKVNFLFPIHIVQVYKCRPF